MGGSPPVLERPKRMLDGLLANLHYRWSMFYPYLHRIDDDFTFPAFQPPFLYRSTLHLH